MLDRADVDESERVDGRGDSVDTQDSLQGAPTAATAARLMLPAAGDIALPSSIPRRPADDSRATSSSTGSKPLTEASTLPIRGLRSPPDAVQQLLTAGPADSVRDAAGKPVSINPSKSDSITN